MDLGVPGSLGSHLVRIHDGTTFGREQVKIEVAADLAQLVLDITGILGPTPLSDGTNALISLARGRWSDAVISAVSIVPYFGNLSKLGKLPRCLESIRKAVRLACTDKVWGQRLRETFGSLKRLLDKVFDVAGDQIPDSARKTLQKMLDEINDFLMPGSVARRSAGGSSAKTKFSAKGGGDGGGTRGSGPKKQKPKEAVSSKGGDGKVGGAKNSDAPQVRRKIPREKLKYKPKNRGDAPIGADDKPVELHHTDQPVGNKSPRDEMTMTDHRGKGNFEKNHPNTGQKPSAVDRAESSKQHKQHWKDEWDSGRFDDLPDQK